MDISPRKKIWTETYRIHSYDMDMHGIANVPQLCKYMQESAWHHAENLQVGYSQFMKQSLIWVLGAMRVEVSMYPQWGESATVDTWPSGRSRLAYLRDFKISSNKQELLAVATTKWYALDLTTRKPVSIDHMFHYDLSQVEQATSHIFSNLVPDLSGEPSKPFHVVYSDMDVNQHVNNVRYIEWLLDNFSLEFYKAHELRTIEIHFNAEALFGDELNVMTIEKDDYNYQHHLIRNTDKKTLCIAQTTWSKK